MYIYIYMYIYVLDKWVPLIAARGARDGVSRRLRHEVEDDALVRHQEGHGVEALLL